MSVKRASAELSAATVEAPEPQPTDPVGEIEALLSGSGPRGQEPAEGSDTAAQEPAETPRYDVRTIAERLGVDPAILYEQITFSVGDEEVSLGALKDRVQELQKLDAARSEVTRARAEYEADRIRAEREISELLAAIPRDKVDPALAEVVKRQQAERLSREREAMLRTIPEWVDAEARNRDREEILGVLADYRYTAADLDTVVDHRLLWLLRDFAKLRASQAKPAPPPKVAVKPQPAKPVSEAQEIGKLKAQIRERKISQAEAVSRILARHGVKT